LALLRLLSRVEGPVLSEVISVISELLRQNGGTEYEEQTLRVLCQKFVALADVAARTAILQIVGDMHERHPLFGPALLKFLVNNFEGLPGEVKLQSLALAAKLTIFGSDSEIPLYFLKICARNPEFDIQDRARLLVALLLTPSENLRLKAREILSPCRPPAKWTDQGSESQFTIGSLSQLFGREIAGYERLPEWAENGEIPPDSVRMPPKKAPVKRVLGHEEDGDEEEDIDISEFFDAEKGTAPVPEGEEDGEELAEEEGEEEEVDGEPEEDIDGFFN
jgi:AP-3 complex subunit beta